MKRIITVFLIVLFLCGCSAVKTYDEINYKQLNKMLDRKESFILFIGSSTCSACSGYKVTLDNVIEKYNVDVKYIDLSKLTSAESSKMNAKFPITGTPTTIFIENGEEKDVYNRIVGNVRYSKVVEKFKKNNYIKE